jgi:DNA-binding PadR family transcriptional regulator
MGTLGYAILGLLAKRPATGYQISRAMQRPVGYFWTARHSQIYPELAELESEGLVRSRVIEGPGPRDTKRYAITAAGRNALRAWLDSSLPDAVPKDELMLRVWSLWLLSPDRARELITAVRDREQARIEILLIEEENFLAQPEAVADPRDHAFGEYATLRWGLARRRAFLEWCDWLLDRLSRAAPSPGPARPAE